MKEYTSEDIQILDNAIEGIRKHPKMYAGEKPWGARLASNLVNNLIYLKALPTKVEKINNWWIIISEKDWLAKKDGTICFEPFSKFYKDPAPVINSSRMEVIIAALADAVVTCGYDGVTWISSDKEDLPKKIHEQFLNIGTKRAVAYKIVNDDE